MRNQNKITIGLIARTDLLALSRIIYYLDTQEDFDIVYFASDNNKLFIRRER